MADAKDTAAVEQAALYEKADIIKASDDVFNVQPEIMEGALYGVTEPLTLDQVKTKLNRFLSKPIKRG